jgi:hypothetical protein
MTLANPVQREIFTRLAWSASASVVQCSVLVVTGAAVSAEADKPSGSSSWAGAKRQRRHETSEEMQRS